MLFHDQPHSLSVTHSLTHQPCFVQEAGADNHQSLLQINHPQILTHVAQKKKKKKSVYKPTTCQPNQLLAPRHCDSKAEHKFSYSAFYPHRTSPRVISRGCRVYLPCFLQSEQTHHHTWIAAVSTQTDPPLDMPPSLPVTQARIFIIKYYQQFTFIVGKRRNIKKTVSL